MKPIQKNLGDILMESGIVSEAEIKEALRRQANSGRRLGVELTEMGLCTTEDIERALAIQFAMPFTRLTPGQVDMEAAGLITPELAMDGNLVPTWAVGDTVHVVMADPTDEEIVDRLLAETGGQVQISLGVPSEIRQAIRVVYGSERSGPHPSLRFSTSLFSDDEITSVNDDDTGRTFLHTLLGKAAAASCAGILLEPLKSGGGQIRFRSATHWRVVATCSRDWYLEIEAQLERLGRVEATAEPFLKTGLLPTRDVGGGERIWVWDSAEGRVALVVPAVDAGARRSVEFADPTRAMADLTGSDGVVIVDSSPTSLDLAAECLATALTGEGHTVLVAHPGLKRMPAAHDPGSVIRFPASSGRLNDDWQRTRDLPFSWLLLGNADDDDPLRAHLDSCLRRKRLATSLAAGSTDQAARRLLDRDAAVERALPDLVLLQVVVVPMLCHSCRQQLTVPAAVLEGCGLDPEQVVYAPMGCTACNATGIVGERILGEAVRLADLAEDSGRSARHDSISAWLATLLHAGEVALADYVGLTGSVIPDPHHRGSASS